MEAFLYTFAVSIDWWLLDKTQMYNQSTLATTQSFHTAHLHKLCKRMHCISYFRLSVRLPII